MLNKFDTEQFRDLYQTQLPLGAFCGGEGTLFRLWAPSAQQVTLRLYRAGDEVPPEQVLAMQPKENGVW